MDARELTRWVAAARIGAGLAFAVAPRALGEVLVGADAAAPGARLFIAAFGARDVLLRAGTLAAAARRRRFRPGSGSFGHPPTRRRQAPVEDTVSV